MTKYVLALTLLFSVSTFASGKKTIEEAKADMLAFVNPEAHGCIKLISNLNNQSTCELVRTALHQCSIVAVDENGQVTDVSTVVQCRQ